MRTLQFTQESELRISKVRREMALAGADALLIADNANLYYLCGIVFRGYIYLPAQGRCVFFAIRPVDMRGDDLVYVRKPEQIPEELKRLGLPLPANLGLELDDLSYTDVERLRAAISPKAVCNASTQLRRARMVKTDKEIALIHEDGVKQAAA